MLFTIPTLLLFSLVSSLISFVSAGTEGSHLLAERENVPLIPQPTPLAQFEPRFFRGHRHRKTTTKKAGKTTAAPAGTVVASAIPPSQITPPAVGSPPAVTSVAASESAVPPPVDSSVASSPVDSAAVSSVAPPVETQPVNTGTGGAGPGTDTPVGGSDAQTSLTLDPSVINENFKDDGQNPPVAGQIASLTSPNNFINFCLTQTGVPLTNGLQIKDGSCNQAPMGRILPINRIPACKFVFPNNLATIPSGQAFTIQLKINNMNTGNFVNAAKSYFAAPAQVDETGTILGHSHVVIEQIDSLESTAILNPLAFSFFKGLNGQANAEGILTADVPAPGLAAGFYKMSSINSAANHQPVLVAVAQHGSIDDAVYFTVTDGGASVPEASTPTASAPSAAVATASEAEKTASIETDDASAVSFPGATTAASVDAVSSSTEAASASASAAPSQTQVRRKRRLVV